MKILLFTCLCDNVQSWNECRSRFVLCADSHHTGMSNIRNISIMVEKRGWKTEVLNKLHYDILQRDCFGFNDDRDIHEEVDNQWKY